MAKKLFTLLFLAVLAFPLSTGMFAQDASMKMAKEKEASGRERSSGPNRGQIYPDRSQRGWWSRDDHRVRQLDPLGQLSITPAKR